MGNLVGDAIPFILTAIITKNPELFAAGVAEGGSEGAASDAILEINKTLDELEKVKEIPAAEVDENHEFTYEEPAHPSGSMGAARTWTKKARLKAAQLPTKGKVRFVPEPNYQSSLPLSIGNNKGFMDKFANEWTKGPSRTKGQAFEWDIQLSKTGRKKLGWLSRDGKHLNVSLDGKVTH